MGPVHLAITHVVIPEKKTLFKEKLHAFAQASLSEPGVSGIHLLEPADTATYEYGILRSFETKADADRFYDSDFFATWRKEVAEMIQGEPQRRQLDGLEAFFRSESTAMPPRWKMACVTFLGVLPTVLFWSTLLPPALSSLHWLLVAAIVNAAVVATLTWAAMPMLTRLFHGWLHESPR